MNQYLEPNEVKECMDAMDKIIRETGLRVGDDAKEALADILQEKGKDVSTTAKRFAEHQYEDRILK